MKLLHSRMKSSGALWVAVCVILLFAYATLVFSAGPFSPGATLDPVVDFAADCSGPTDADCYVTDGWSVNTGSSYVYSATTDLVGIGDSTPTYKLDVNGDIAIGDITGASEFKMYSTSLSTYADLIKLSGTNLALGAYKTAVGAGQGGALGAITSGSNNILIGRNTGIALTTGSENIFIGNNAGQDTNVPGNTFIGYSAGSGNASGVENVFVGWNAGRAFTGDGNTLLGYNTGGVTGTGSYNTYVGSEAGAGSANMGVRNVFVGALNGTGNAGGLDNVFIGYGAGVSNTDGASNILVGSGAGDNITTGNSNIIIGTNIDAVSATGSNQLTIGDTLYGDLSNDYISIGDSTPDFALDVEEDRASSYAASFFNDGNLANRWGVSVQAGRDTPGDGDTYINFSDGDGTALATMGYLSGSVQLINISDRRIKENIEDTSIGLDDLLSIQVRDFSYISDDQGKTVHGFIAQELYEAYPDAVSVPEDPDEYWKVSYSQLIPLIVKSIQELDITISSIESQIAQLPTNQTFLSTIRAWFADATNGITDFFARKITTSELCVDDVCVTRDEFKALLQASVISGSESTSDAGDNVGSDTSNDSGSENSAGDNAVDGTSDDAVNDTTETETLIGSEVDTSDDAIPAQDESNADTSDSTTPESNSEDTDTSSEISAPSASDQEDSGQGV